MKKSWYILMDGSRKVAGGLVAEMSLIRVAQQNDYYAKQRSGCKWEPLIPRLHDVYVGELAA